MVNLFQGGTFNLIVFYSLSVHFSKCCTWESSGPLRMFLGDSSVEEIRREVRL